MTSKGLGMVPWSVLLALAAIGAPASPAAAATFTVGADPPPACTANAIIDALFAAAFNPGPDEIRIARDQSYTDQFLHLTDWDPATIGALTIAGGYDDCADGTPSEWTTIDGQAGQSTFEIDTTGVHESRVTLRNLVIVGSGVRGVKVEGNTRVTLESSFVQTNGGGIDVEPGATVEVDRLSIVRNNRGGFGQGGGIRCWGGTVVLHGPVLSNLATDGGGLFAGNGCTVELHTGASLASNEAADGGGLYAEGGSSIRSISESTSDHVRVNANTATNDGGGVYATGTNTSVDLSNNVTVNRNQAGVRGGGIYVEQQAEVSLLRSSRQCEDPVRCTTLFENLVTASNTGAAAYVGSGGTLYIEQTYVEGNAIPASASYGSIVHAEGPGALLFVESVAFWNNSADALLEGVDGAKIFASYVSASGNRFGRPSPSIPIVLSSAAQGELRSSIFWPNSPVLETGGSLNVSDCLIVSDATGLPAGTWSVIDPLFRNAVGGDLHLRVDSPAVDYCGVIPTSAADGDFELHGYDLAENPNGLPGLTGGVFDIGYDEVWHFFYDGFESGDTSAWSSTTP